MRPSDLRGLNMKRQTKKKNSNNDTDTEPTANTCDGKTGIGKWYFPKILKPAQTGASATIAIERLWELLSQESVITSRVERKTSRETERESDREKAALSLHATGEQLTSKSELSVAERAGERQRCLVVQLRLSRVQAETHQTSVQFSPRDGLIANGRIVAPSQRRASRHSRNSNSSSYL